MPTADALETRAVPDPLDALTLDDLRRRTSVKWRRYPADVLPLWVAEMDAVLAPGVVDAVARAMQVGDTGYDSGTRYAEAWAAYAADRWGWTVDVGRARTMPDVMTGVVHVVRATTDEGGAVVVSPPVYPPFFEFVETVGRRVVEAPLTATGRLDLADGGALDTAFAAARAGGRPALYLLANPHNPTGVAHAPDELAALCALADRHGVQVLADEIHAPLTGRPGVDDVPVFTPLLTVPGGERALSLVSPSKAWNLAGLRAALLLSGPAADDAVDRVPLNAREAVNHVGVLAQTAALETGGEWLDAVLDALVRRRALLADLLAEHLPEVGYDAGHATYLAWLDCRALGLGDDPAAALLDEGRVALNSGLPFGTGGEGFVRLNLATSPSIVSEAVARMTDTVERPGARG
ncbi:aminotransferase class I/II-fold pyridoxal phosphate-dependent enzyme [Luteimicrobium subarcticum]|uniref:cysteine-S-conjugate beta-lyase n=1 Tax=Luteimicrobium subarcticum TaxID=620910 RepID=A0A2M8WRU8_9MICO|nr:aminotransferase class I/II-fold pyridoxal phosphate-dependent enzyme [Luteimicrobium subarcticum]PJI93638.1 cystathionine beta-lyase [Luteimicrobium subarcticum]